MKSTELSLLACGWDEAWSELFAQASSSLDVAPGRIVRAGREPWVRTAEGDLVARLALTRATLQPVCGDWVMAELLRDSDGAPTGARIRGVLPRRTALVRGAAGSRVELQTIVANVNVVWILCGLDRDQGLRSLERYQAIVRAGAELGDVGLAVVLNKVDTCADLAAAMARARNAAPSTLIVPTSATTGEGLNELRTALTRGQTVALVGPSGVGKSTLVGALAPGVTVATHAVRARDHRGCHTTSASQLETTPGGALLIDTPGLRELTLRGESASSGVDGTFSDIVDLARGCRFRDCLHASEPHCAVKKALEEGRLSTGRFLRYLDLKRQVEARERRRSRGARGFALRSSR